MSRICRRRFVLAAGALLIMRRAVAQQAGRVYRVGVLFDGGSSTWGPYHEALRERLAAQGFVEGRNLQTIWRGGTGYRHEDREAARALVAARPDAILSFSSSMTQAVQWATNTVPIVFANVGDPIADGIVKSYARPGGNVTGVSSRERQLLAKRFELLRELLPKAKRIAYVRPPFSDPATTASEALARDIAARLGFELIVSDGVGQLGDLEAKRPEAMLVYFVLGTRLTTENLIATAARLRIPTVFADAESVTLGGLAAYGTDPIANTRLAADLLTRVLKGATPAEIPVDQAARFELVVNMKTAKAIGLTIPQSILLRADRVIE